MSQFNHKKRTLPEALGLKRERFEELLDETKEILHAFAEDEIESNSELIEELTKVTNDPVELALVSFRVGETLGKFKQDHDENCPIHGHGHAIKQTSVEIHVKGGKFSPEKQEKIAKAIRSAIEDEDE